jgi:hypothetical protein
MTDDPTREAIRSLLIAAESLIDGLHPSSPDDVPAQVAADAARDVDPLLARAREGEPEWDALNDLATAVRLAVAARLHGARDGLERMQNLAVCVTRAQGVLDGLETMTGSAR